VDINEVNLQLNKKQSSFIARPKQGGSGDSIPNPRACGSFEVYKTANYMVSSCMQ